MEIDSDNECVPHNHEVELEHEDDNDSCEIVAVAGPSKSKSQKRNFINSRLVSALDRCKVSDRSAVHIITAVAEALGYCVDELVINRSTIQRLREANRVTITKEIKENFKV